MKYIFLKFEIENAVGRITFSRPNMFNTFNTDMLQEFQDALKKCAEDKNVRAVMLTGEGKGFSAGQDITEALPNAENQIDANNTPVDLGDVIEKNYNPVVRLIRNMEKPVLCAVNGVAAGAGANVALACDIVFAVKSASFIQSSCKIGLVPDCGGTFFLPRLVGMSRATAMMLLGETISAEKALEYGMIYKVFDDNEELMNQAVMGAEYLAKQPTLAYALTKKALNAAFENDLDKQLELEKDLQREAGNSQDFNEGITAFLEKRKPDFKGE